MTNRLGAHASLLAPVIVLCGCLSTGMLASDPRPAAATAGVLPGGLASPVAPVLGPGAPALPGAGVPGALPAGETARLIGDFSAVAWPSWENVTYFPWSPKVTYRPERGPDGEALAKAISRDAGSMFLRRVAFDPRTTPIVRWRWRVPGPVPGANERVRSTDDAAARIYFVWGLRDKGDLFKAEALGYIWGRTRHPGEIGASPFSDHIGIVCLRAGRNGAGAWQEERRDLEADHRAYFKRAPSGPVTAIAILTDTDDTNGAATATYGPIFVEPRR